MEIPGRSRGSDVTRAHGEIPEVLAGVSLGGVTADDRPQESGYLGIDHIGAVEGVEP